MPKYSQSPNSLQTEGKTEENRKKIVRERLHGAAAEISSYTYKWLFLCIYEDREL